MLLGSGIYLSGWKSAISVRNFISVLCEFEYNIRNEAVIISNWIHLLVSIIFTILIADEN